jgi:hypothetical protein
MNLICAMVLCFVAMLSAARAVFAGASVIRLPSDGSGVAFVRADVYQGKAIVFGAGSGGPTNTNSVRSFDGVKWEALWPNAYTNGGAHQRHNGTLVVVPRLKQVWIFGGSHLETLPGALRSGRFDLETRKWLATSTTDQGAFEGVVAGGIGFRPNQAAAWSAELDMGVFFGGSSNGVYDDQWIIEPNPGGPAPYKLTQFTGPRPPARTQAQNLMVAVGSNFYLVGGMAGQLNGTTLLRQDFWKFDGKARSWTPLPKPPGDGYQANVTYDPLLNKIVFWASSNLYTFDIAANSWSTEAVTTLPCKMNQIGVYLSSIKAHYFEGGNACSGAGDYGPGYAITLSSDSRKNENRTAIAEKSAAQENAISTKPTGRADLPLKTWVARRYTTPNAPGHGVDGHGTGGKHFRLAANPVNGRIYFLGGDWSTVHGEGSFKNSTWSYDIATDKWSLEYPYCGNPGEIMPARPDEVGWVYDTKRNLFWMLPGFMGTDQSGPGICGKNPNSAKQVSAILTFDPATKKWANPGAAGEPLNPGVERSKSGVYDPVTDSIWRCSYDGGMGMVWTVYNIAQNKWQLFQTPNAEGGKYINDVHLTHEYLAIDPAGRRIYAIDPNHYQLLILNMQTRSIKIGAAIPNVDPGKPPSLADFTIPVWDSVNRVLLYPYIRSLANSRPKLLIYHPDTNSWETEASTRGDGHEVRGNAAVFDPVNNALLVMGGLTDGGDVDPSVTHFFLYRYGNGGGATPPSVSAAASSPPAPASAPPIAAPSSRVSPAGSETAMSASYLGISEDRVGQPNSLKPDGEPDFKIQLFKIRSAPVRVRIESDTGGIWETPWNGTNWVPLVQYQDATKTANIWFAQFQSQTFTVTVWYADGTSDTAPVGPPRLPR